MEEAEKLREVVKKSPEKAKKVHLYNQHQSPPIWVLLSAIFFYLIPLQSTEAHKTRFDTRKFIFLTFKDIPAHLLTKFPSLSDGAWVASLLCIQQIFVFHFWSKLEKRV